MKIILCLVLFFFLNAGARSAVAKSLVTTETEIDKDFKRLVTNPLIPGLSVAVADKAGIAWAKAYGYADLENNVGMHTKHKLRIGSISKPMATAAMMRLVEAGKLDIDEAVSSSVEYWPDKHPKITLRQIASHTSGIRNYGHKKEFLFNQPFLTTKESVAIFQDDALLFNPGKDYKYSTLAWALLTAVIESSHSSNNFEQVMTEEVFLPLRMPDTVFDQQFNIVENRARPYIVKDASIINAPQTDHSYKWAGGGFISTPSDVSKFAIGHLDDQYLAGKIREDMFTESMKSNGETVIHGIGWVVNFQHYKDRLTANPRLIEYIESHSIVGHAGGSMGGISLLLMCTDHGKAVTVVKNVSGGPNLGLEALAFKTLRAFDVK